MRVIVLFLVLLGPIAVLAEDIRTYNAFFSLSSDVNGEDSPLKSINCLNTEITREVHQSSNIINKCMKDICGNPENNETETLTDKNIGDFIELEGMDIDLTPMKDSLRSAMRAEVEKNKEMIKIAKNLLDPDEIEESLEDLYAFEWEDILQQLYSPYITIITNPLAIDIKNRVTIKLNEDSLRNIPNEIRKNIEAYTEKLKNHINEGPWHTKITHRAYTIEEARTMLQSKVQQLSKEIKKELDNDIFLQSF